MFRGDLRELLIGLWRAVERAGGRPTISATKRAARELGASFPDAAARTILLPFDKHGKNVRPDAKENCQVSRLGGAYLPPTVRPDFPAQTPTISPDDAEASPGLHAREICIPSSKVQDNGESTTPSLQKNLEEPLNLESSQPRARGENEQSDPEQNFGRSNLRDQKPAGENAESPAVIFPARDFARWFVTEGLRVGAIPAHRGLDIALAVRRESLEDAASLLTAYGREECERRAMRLFEARKANQIKREPTIAALSATWGWEEIQGRPARDSVPLDCDYNALLGIGGGAA
jgi:hypothetical protein